MASSSLSICMIQIVRSMFRPSRNLIFGRAFKDGNGECRRGKELVLDNIKRNGGIVWHCMYVMDMLFLLSLTVDGGGFPWSNRVQRRLALSHWFPILEFHSTGPSVWTDVFSSICHSMAHIKWTHSLRNFNVSNGSPENTYSLSYLESKSTFGDM